MLEPHIKHRDLSLKELWYTNSQKLMGFCDNAGKLIQPMLMIAFKSLFNENAICMYCSVIEDSIFLEYVNVLT